MLSIYLLSVLTSVVTAGPAGPPWESHARGQNPWEGDGNTPGHCPLTVTVPVATAIVSTAPYFFLWHHRRRRVLMVNPRHPAHALQLGQPPIAATPTPWRPVFATPRLSLRPSD